jgi:UDP-glucuronate decarboxylase
MKDVLEEDFDKITKRDISWDALRNSSFVITGATGLIGSLIVKYLLYVNRTMNFGAKIYAVVRNVEKADKIFAEEKTDALTYVVADLTKEKVNCEGDCDYIVHAAAVTASKVMVSDPVGTICTSIDGTEKMLQLAVEKKAKAFIYISSMEIYGQPTVGGKTAEKDLGYVDIENVRSCYPEGKRMCECLCTAYAAQYGVNVISARLAQTFGAGILPTENRVFAQFARSVMRGENIVLHTTGESEGNYVYTADAIAAIMTLLVKGKAGEAYNIANEDSHITIRNMAELVAREIAGEKIQVVIDIPEDSVSLGYAPPVKMWLDASKMRELGWKPEIGLVEAYKRMICWMK